MQPNPESESLVDVDLGPWLDRLAHPGDSDSPFVSCYLDTRGGRQACRTFLHRKVTHIRRSLRGLERFEFDSAVEMIHGALDSDWCPQAQGMAIFARGVSRDRHFDVLHAAVPVDNRLVRYPTPEILPLIALHQREPAFSLLLIRHDGMRLFERPPGLLTGLTRLDRVPRVGSIDRLTGQDVGDGAGCDPFDPEQEAVWRFHRSLEASSLPLLIAGDAEALSDAVDWLPQRVIDRLVGSLPLSPGDGLEALVLSARTQIRTLCWAESNRLAGQLVDRARGQGPATLGYRSTLRAIRNGEATRLVITDWDHPGLGLPWEDEIAICYEALRNGVRIVLSDSIPLREAGGVGCLLKGQSDRASISHRVHPAGLRRVA